MGCVQQAVLEFDQEVQAPWRPRLVSDTGAAPEVVRHPSRRVTPRVGTCRPPVARRVAPQPQARPVIGVRAAGPASGAEVFRPVRTAAAPARRRRVRLTARARRLAFVLAVAGGIATGSWLDSVFGDVTEVRLAGESSVVVEAGDTLWSIASSVAGEDDVRAVVDEIRLVNGLETVELMPGQVLQLP